MSDPAHITPLDWAVSLPVGPRAQLAWLYCVQHFQTAGWMPNAAQIAGYLGVDERQARRLVADLIDAGEFHRDMPGVLELAEAI
jgi:hypothetical protein